MMNQQMSTKRVPQRPSWTWALFAASDEKLELRPHRNGCEKPTKLLLVGANVFVHCDNVYVFNLITFDPEPGVLI